MRLRRAARRHQAHPTTAAARVAAAAPGIGVNPVRADEVKVDDVILRYGTNPRTWQYAMRIVVVVTPAPDSSPNDLRIVFADGGVVYYNAPAELLKVVRA